MTPGELMARASMEELLLMLAYMEMEAAAAAG
jgi:hypothetical protein